MTKEVQILRENVINILISFGNDISLLLDKADHQPTKWLIGGVIQSIQREISLFSQIVEREEAPTRKEKEQDVDKTSNS
jgi:hypothetical protein